MPAVFVDTNVFLRHLVQDNADQSPRASAFLQRLERGEVEAETSQLVVAEVIFTLERTYKTPKSEVRRLLLDVMALRGLALPGSPTIQDALDLYVQENVSYGDAFNAVEMARRGLTTVVSFDHDFDRVPWLTRIEP